MGRISIIELEGMYNENRTKINRWIVRRERSNRQHERDWGNPWEGWHDEGNEETSWPIIRRKRAMTSCRDTNDSIAMAECLTWSEVELVSGDGRCSTPY